MEANQRCTADSYPVETGLETQDSVECQQTHIGRGLARLAGAAMGLALVVGPACAQAQQLLPPENKDGIKGRAWISGAVLLLVLAMVGFAAFMKTKRGSQD